MRKRDRQGRATQSGCSKEEEEEEEEKCKSSTSLVPRVTPGNEQREKSDGARTKEEYQRKKGGN